jgi:uncharacterized protein (TIGR02284 family)
MNNSQPSATLAVLDILGDLVAISRDGQDGFATAAEHARAPELGTFFSAVSQERQAMVSELQVLEREFGKLEVDGDASLVGKLHRAWINLKTALARDEDQAILEEAERGEDAALKAYQDALNVTDPPLSEKLIALLKGHLASIKDSHFEVKVRLDSGKYSTN